MIDEGGRAVFAKNPDKERPIASISKLAATLVVAEKGVELEGLSTINKNDIEVAKGGARSRLFEGMTLSNRDLLHSALMGSDNRAIPALGRAVKLTPAQLTTAMNAKARALGLKNTRFHEPTGLSTGNVSTPREIIAMLRAVMANPIAGGRSPAAPSTTRTRSASRRSTTTTPTTRRRAATSRCWAARPATTTRPATAWWWRPRSTAAPTTWRSWATTGR